MKVEFNNYRRIFNEKTTLFSMEVLEIVMNITCHG